MGGGLTGDSIIRATDINLCNSLQLGYNIYIYYTYIHTSVVCEKSTIWGREGLNEWVQDFLAVYRQCSNKKKKQAAVNNGYPFTGEPLKR